MQNKLLIILKRQTERQTKTHCVGHYACPKTHKSRRVLCVLWEQDPMLPTPVYIHRVSKKLCKIVFVISLSNAYQL